MKNRHTILPLMISIILSSVAGSSAWATAPYGMEYSGGEPLGAENVQIDPNLVSGLTALMKVNAVNVTVSSAAEVQQGYILDAERCLPYMYVAVPNGEYDYANKNITYTIGNDQYEVKAKLNKITTSNIPDGQKLAIGLINTSSIVWGGYGVYQDATCSAESRIEDITSARVNQDMRIFGEFNIKLFKKTDSDQPFVTKGLYFRLTDIDATQSYKILNSDNALTTDNMFALNAEGLQKQGEGPFARNMYVESGHYIYSENKIGDDWGSVGLPSTANIYTVLNNSTQSQGLDIVFGFASIAASGIEYYAPQLKVSYNSDDNGKITGKTTEQIIVDNNPSGSSEESNLGYIFSHWVADVDLKLDDGTEIPAGSPLTSEQVTKVVVRDDIVFTAIHVIDPDYSDEDVPATPNTGAVTGSTNGTLIVTSILGIAVATLVIAIMPRVLKKRVNFIKK